MEFVEQIPLQRGYKYNWEQIAKDLKEHPGEWGVVTADGAAGTEGAAAMAARRIRTGQDANFPRGEFESTQRRNVIYARYVGRN